MKGKSWLKRFTANNEQAILSRDYPSPLLNNEPNKGKYTCNEEEMKQKHERDQEDSALANLREHMTGGVVCEPIHIGESPEKQQTIEEEYVGEDLGPKVSFG